MQGSVQTLSSTRSSGSFTRADRGHPAYGVWQCADASALLMRSGGKQAVQLLAEPRSRLCFPSETGMQSYPRTWSPVAVRFALAQAGKSALQLLSDSLAR